MIKIINVCLGVLFVLLLGWQVQEHLPYQLCQLEHTNLFLGDWDSLWASLGEMGGFVKWIGTFGIQFFDKPFWGSVVFLLPVWGLFAMTGCILRRKCASAGLWIPLAAWVAVAQLFSLYDFNFYWSGAVALCMAVAGLWVCSFLKSSWLRTILFIVGIPVVAWLWGSVVVVYVLGGIGLFFEKKKSLWTALVPLLVCGGTIALNNFMGGCPTWMNAISPTQYFESLLDIPSYHLLTWILVVLLLGISRFLSWNVEKKKVLAGVICVLGWLLPSGALIYYGSTFRNQSNID